MKYKPGEIALLNDLETVPWERGVRQGGMMNIEQSRLNLFDLVDILNSCNIKYTIFFGTLLGAIRENNFIADDSDTDILCFRDDYRKADELVKRARRRGFRVPLEELPMMDHYFIRNGEKIDINWILDNGHNEMLYDHWIKWDKKFFEQPFPTMRFRGKIVNIPHHSIELIELMYGKNWRIPQHNKKGFL
jgi:lipopolysaccharide cholinephosphotransferase